jgi:hypothetical protein
MQRTGIAHSADGGTEPVPEPKINLCVRFPKSLDRKLEIAAVHLDCTKTQYVIDAVASRLASEAGAA